MRLVDADKLRYKHSLNTINTTMPQSFPCITKEEINKAPTVEAIPKAEVKKFLEEGTKDVSNNVLAIVREDYIHKADYETRLKADMVAMLTEIWSKITEKSYYDTTIIGDYEDEVRINLVELDDVNEIIIEKINELKEGTDET